MSNLTLPTPLSQTMIPACSGRGGSPLRNQFAAGAISVPDLDLQGLLDAAFSMGGVIVLLDLQTETWTPGQWSAMGSYLGEHDASDGLTPPTFYDGDGHFSVDLASMRPTYGYFQNGVGFFANGMVNLNASYNANQPALQFEILLYELQGSFTADGIADGVICGAINAWTLVDRLASVASFRIKSGNQTLRVMLDADGSCLTDPNCQPGSPEACSCISQGEILSSPLFQAFSPDLDFDPSLTNPFVADPSNLLYKNDYLSIGLMFSAHRAQFDSPDLPDRPRG